MWDLVRGGSKCAIINDRYAKRVMVTAVTKFAIWNVNSVQSPCALPTGGEYILCRSCGGRGSGRSRGRCTRNLTVDRFGASDQLRTRKQASALQTG